jgi:hypothetical protein
MKGSNGKKISDYPAIELIRELERRKIAKSQESGYPRKIQGYYC